MCSKFSPCVLYALPPSFLDFYTTPKVTKTYEIPHQQINETKIQKLAAKESVIPRNEGSIRVSRNVIVIQPDAHCSFDSMANEWYSFEPGKEDVSLARQS